MLRDKLLHPPTPEFRVVMVLPGRPNNGGRLHLNDHSLFNDTEANVILRSPDLIRATRERLWAEHLELPLDDMSGDPTRMIDQVWRPVAEEQQRRQSSNLPLTHRLVRLPHRSCRSARLLGPLLSYRKVDTPSRPSHARNGLLFHHALVPAHALQEVVAVDEGQEVG